MIRHSALFVWAEGIADEQKVRVKDGVAFCYYGSEVARFIYVEHHVQIAVETLSE